MSQNEFKEKNSATNVANVDDNKSFKREKSRFEFALFINDFLVCKRNFPITGYVEKSMMTAEFKSEIDRIVELIDNDLKAKSRIYTTYHFPEFKTVDGSFILPEWEPEIMTSPLSDEGVTILKFAIFEDGREVISKVWDARYYPSFVRKNIDLTNRQVKITRNDKTEVYDKETYFADHGSHVFGELYVLKHMISDREDLIPVIQKMIYEVCSYLDGYYEHLSDYHVMEEYKNCDIKRDENGNPIYTQLAQIGLDGNEYGVTDAFGNPWMIPVLDKPKKGKKYHFDIDYYNSKVESAWEKATAEKTRQYMNELYFPSKENSRKKKRN